MSITKTPETQESETAAGPEALKGVFSSVDHLAYRLFRRSIEKNPDRYYAVETSLKQAKKAVPVEVYLPRSIFLAVIAAIAFGALGVFASGVLTRMGLGFGNETLGLLLANPIFMVIVCSGFGAALGFSVVYNLMLLAPKLSASSRAEEIDDSLIDAVVYMFAMSQGGKNILEMFRIISQNPHIFRELSVEATSLVREVEFLGVDLQTALHDLALFTPARNFKEFLESLASILATGGDLPLFFRNRAEQLRVEASYQNRLLLETLSLFAEIYVTALVAGPLFILVILIVMGLIGSVQSATYGAIIYIFIPFGSAMFIFLLKITRMETKEAEGAKEAKTRIKKLKKSGLITEDAYKRMRALETADSKVRFYNFLHHPWNGLTRKPSLVLVFCMPVALLILMPNIIRVWGFPVDVISSYMTNYILIALLITIIPYSILYEARNRRIRRINSSLPEFLKRLANLNQSGLPVPKALRALMKSNLGVLNTEVHQISNQIDWGSSTSEALDAFARRVNTRIVTRLITLINRASEYTSDLRDTLGIAATDAMATENLRKERQAGTVMYIMIIYIAFAVFLYIIYVLAAVFLPMMPGNLSTIQGGSQIFQLGMGEEKFHTLFYHSCAIMGFSAGLVGGQIANGNFQLGLKHSIVMVLMAMVTFNIIIT